MAKKKEMSREQKAVKALNDSHMRTGGGFYVDVPGRGCWRCYQARLSPGGQVEVREIRGDSEYWFALNLETDKVRDGYGTRPIIL